MPITRKQFEWGVDTEIEDWMNKILAFLAEHENEAFTRDELWKLIYKQTSWQMTVREAFNEALDKLVFIKDVERRNAQLQARLDAYPGEGDDRG